MTWKLVNTGGKVLITTASSGGDTLVDGLGIPNCSLSVRQSLTGFRPMEARSELRFPGTREYRVTLTRGLEDARIAGVTPQTIRDVMTWERLWVAYRDANGVVLFEGWCSWEDLADNQRTLEAAQQSMTLVNDGDPVTPADDADPATWPYPAA